MSGLLVLRLPYQQLARLLPEVMKGACARVNKVLYVHWDPVSTMNIANPSSCLSKKSDAKEASSLIKAIYNRSSILSSTLDVRVLLCGFKGTSEIPVITKHPVQKVLIDYNYKDDTTLVKSRYKSYLNNGDLTILLKEDTVLEITAGSEKVESNQCGFDNFETYKHIVAGGTFDHIHVGHKILLTEGLLRCTDKFTIGIADGPLLVKKTLSDLIEPVEVRMEELKNLLIDIDPSVEYCLEPIYEPLGPSGTDPTMEMIIVSRETLKGGNYVNNARKERNLNVLDVVVIDLIEDVHRSEAEEEKISSSSARRRLLGTVLREPNLDTKSNLNPYVIGLTGGSASGKTSVAKRISERGVTIINCDILGHQAYKKNTDCHKKLFSIYGNRILNEDGEINRKALGAEVFGSSDKLSQLNSIVWPEIAKQITQRVEEAKDAGAKVVLLDAAVLLEAQWDQFCHEVWVCLLPKSEAVRRICERDACAPEQAEARLARQMNDADRLPRCHVAICSLWDYDFTAQQCNKALDTALKRIQ